MARKTRVVGKGTLKALSINRKAAKRFGKAARAVGTRATKPRSSRPVRKGFRTLKQTRRLVLGKPRKR